ncbi:MAG TPA: LysR family transcriptional regulator [Amycolatopsis sp.]|uniref:LysR family transcriptional regulator n=1 Tax=Amycolatopsis sp. TaxID=37632 RepID=UPI002B4790BC|nr:LysR family transcriptional regulator [Amycolatopsis sp.]HKS46157.1 LysR family transcriptional regulator [Amycolatopsis sp.]
MKLGLRHLRIVLTVTDAGSISRAAIAMKVAQSGLSTQLRRIEQTFGAPLFERRPDGILLTDLGVYVVGRARKLLDQFDDLVVTTRALARHDQPPPAFALGGVDNPWVPLIATHIRDRMAHREQLTFVEPSSEAVLELLRSGKIVLAVVHEFPGVAPPRLNGLRVRELGVEPVLAGLGPAHRLVQQDLICLSELAKDTWVAPGDRTDGLRLSLRLACERAGFSPRFRYFGADQATAAAIVGAGNAVAVFPADASGSLPIVMKRLVGGQLWRRTLLVWPADSPLAGLAENLDVASLGRKLHAAS